MLLGSLGASVAAGLAWPNKKWKKSVAESLLCGPLGACTFKVQVECTPLRWSSNKPEKCCLAAGVLQWAAGLIKSEKSQLQRACSVGFWQLALSKCKLSEPPCAGALTSQKDAACQLGCFSGLLAQQKVKKVSCSKLALWASGSFALSKCKLSMPPFAKALISQKDAAWQLGCFHGLLAQQKVRKVSCRELALWASGSLHFQSASGVRLLALEL